jgi:hypothetical protein
VESCLRLGLNVAMQSAVRTFGLCLPNLFNVTERIVNPGFGVCNFSLCLTMGALSVYGDPYGVIADKRFVFDLNRDSVWYLDTL